MPIPRRIRQFFFPSLTPLFLIRVCLVSVFAYLFFNYLCIPFTIRGISMEPTYLNGGVNFCWRLRYLFSDPKRPDVVAVRFAGNEVMLLKRVVACEGEQVEFRGGRLFVNGRGIEESYVRFPCDWNLPSRRVEKDCVYVVGDNRSMPIESQYFGQASKIRVVGGPLW